MDEDLRLTYLARMGIDAWVPRQAEQPAAEPPAQEAAAGVAQPAVEQPAVEQPAVEQPAVEQPAVEQPAVAAAEAPTVSPLVPRAPEPGPDWPTLQAEVADCRRCGLCEGRLQTVFGVGDRRAQLMVVGEAPGAEEDRQGEPFVGRAGQLLTNMLFAMGLRREQVYIANILKCRPPGNRDPRPDEVAACEPYLRGQLELVQPRLILAVGRVAAQNLLKTEQPLGRLRGELHHYGPQETPLLVTYHPAYLLRSPQQKAKAWEDLKRALSLLAASASPP